MKIMLMILSLSLFYFLGCSNNQNISQNNTQNSVQPPQLIDQSCVQQEHKLSQYEEFTAEYFNNLNTEESTVLNTGILCDNQTLNTPLVSQQIFTTLADYILKARHEILIQVYVIHPDGQATLALINAIKSINERPISSFRGPITVKLLYNRQAFADANADKVELLLNEEFKNLDPRKVIFEQKQYKAFTLGLLHSKSFIIDGKDVIFTGANIQHFFDPPPQGEAWTDFGFLFSGGIASVAREDFFDAWLYAAGYGEATIKSLGLYTLMNHEHIALSINNLGENSHAEQGFTEGVPIIFMGKRARDDLLHPSSREAPNTKAILAALKTAKSKIRLYTPNLNISEIKESIVSAVLRGVKVELLLTRKMNEKLVSLPGQDGTNIKNVKEMMQILDDKLPSSLKARIENLDARWFVHDDGTLANDEGERKYLSHAKYYSFDSRLAIIGSYNLDSQSMLNSREIGAAVLESSLVRNWDKMVFSPYFNRALKICWGYKAWTCF